MTPPVVEYSQAALDQVRDWHAFKTVGAPVRTDGIRLSLGGGRGLCPKHGNRSMVVRRGTNRCPRGRKLGTNCL